MSRPVIASAWVKPDYRASLEEAGARVRELTPEDALPHVGGREALERTADRSHRFHFVVERMVACDRNEGERH